MAASCDRVELAAIAGSRTATRIASLGRGLDRLAAEDPVRRRKSWNCSHFAGLESRAVSPTGDSAVLSGAAQWAYAGPGCGWTWRNVKNLRDLLTAGDSAGDFVACEWCEPTIVRSCYAHRCRSVFKPCSWQAIEIAIARGAAQCSIACAATTRICGGELKRCCRRPRSAGDRCRMRPIRAVADDDQPAGHAVVPARSSPAATSCWKQIGEGGMGTVWVAEQTEPVRRNVALKLIKPGMDIAAGAGAVRGRAAGAGPDGPSRTSPRCFDGGMTDEGRPYFVMEYVKGVPITDYCDQARLSRRRAAASCSCRSARRCSTPIRRGSSTAT